MSHTRTFDHVRQGGSWFRSLKLSGTPTKCLSRYRCHSVATATAVLMDDATKSQLEKLQARVELETGRRVTQQERLKRLVERGVRDEEEITETFREPDLPLSQEGEETFFQATRDLGFGSSEEDIDEILYGEEYEDPE